MKTVNTCELIGPALDWAVAKSCGDEHWTSGRNPDWFAWRMRNWKPSTDWAQGGPLIEKYVVSIEFGKNQDDFPGWSAIVGPVTYMQEPDAFGSTPLVAACRAIVTAKLGETVQIPDELWTAEYDTAPASRPNSKDAGAAN
jgi:hypothetical protein